MVIGEYTQITLKTKNLNFTKKKYNLDPNLKTGDIVDVPISKLTKGSSVEVKVECDYCGKILNVPYKRYNYNTKNVNKYACTNKECSNQKIKDVCLVKYGVENPFQADFVKEKSKKTLMEKYGVDHPMHSDVVKNKIKETCLLRYGETNYTKTNEYLEKTEKTNLDKYGETHHNKTKNGKLVRKLTRIRKGDQISDDKIPEYRKYRLIVNRSLQRNKKIIIDNWDGYDYYDNEYIKENFNLESNNRNYPHFDHKISVIYGFRNGISPHEISELDNICLTKQWINGTKGSKCDDEFLIEFKKG